MPRLRLILLTLSMVMCFTFSTAFAEEAGALYGARLQSIDLSSEAVANSKKSFAAKGSDTYVYVSVVVDGRVLWISPKKKFVKGEKHIDWPNGSASTCGIFWEPGMPVTLKVFASDDETDAVVRAGIVGASTGAGVGAVLGGLLGAFGGPLAPATVPLGVGIGAAIGGGVGATTGGMVGKMAATDHLLVEKHLNNNDLFPLNGSIDINTQDGLGGESTSTVSFIMTRSQKAVEKGNLELGKTYLVRFKEIRLSEYALRKGGKDIEKSRYRIVLRVRKKKYPFPKEDKLRLNAGQVTDPNVITILKNEGDETEVLVYETDFLRDDLVFSARIAKLDGKSWVFQGKSTASDIADEESCVVIETYGPMD